MRHSKFLVTDPELNAYVRGVLCKTVGNQRCASARLYIMRTPQFNAMMAPNGMMIVWTGLLLRAGSEAELASVLGHEFGHFEKQHSLQSLRTLRAKSDAAAWMGLAPNGVGMFAQMGLVGSFFEFTRDMERQADLGALDDLAANGYDPTASARIWEQLRAEMDATAKERKTQSLKDMGGGFFGTHPSSAERMEYLKAAADRKPARSYRDGAADYRAAIKGWWPQLIDDQIKTNDFGATEYLLGQLASDGWTPELLYARGELYRSRAKAGDLERAVGYYKQSIAANADIAENWRGLGLAMLRSGDAGGGKRALKTYPDKRPDAADRGIIAMMIGRD